MDTEPTRPHADPASSLDPLVLAGLLSPAVAPLNPEELPKDLGERYEVRGVLGQGGQGVVLAVRDRLLEREVAAKLARRDSPGADEHLAHEARLAAVLEHPNILPVYDLAEAPDGAPLLVMRRAPGRSLEEALSAGEHPRGVAVGATAQLAGRAARLRVFLELAGAIAYAHSRGVLHLDLKPANVRVGDYGEVFVMDWGLARRLSEQAAPVGGTPPYMAPELLEGLPPDERADIYSLGIILYRMLSGGALPFQGDTSDFELYRRALAAGRMVGLAERDPAIDPDLAAVVDRACRVNRAERYRKVRDLLADLEAAMDGRPVTARRASWPQKAAKWTRRHGRALAFAAVAGILVAVSAAYMVESLRRAEADRRRALARIPFDKGQETALLRPPDLGAAERLFDRAIETDPGFADAWYARGRCRQFQGKAAEALGDLERAAELDPSLIMARYHAGKIHMEQFRDTESAGREFAAMRRLDADNEYSLLGEGWLCTLRGEWPEALDFAARAARANPGLDEVHSLRGFVFSSSRSPLRDPAKAVAEYDLYLARSPDDVTALNNRGFAFAQLGLFADAERDLDRALALDPNYCYALSIRGWLRLQRDDLVGALGDFDRALRLSPDHAGNLLNRGIVQERQGRIDEARADYAAAASRDPTNPAPLDRRAMLELRAGDYDAAAGLFAQAIALEKPKRSHFLKRLRGYAAYYGGEAAEAEAAWRAGLAERAPGARLYAGLPLWRLLVETGRAAEADQMLVELAKAPREKAHLAAAARFCLGQIPWAEVLKQPRSAAEFCETLFYMGLGASARGQELDAIEYFRACRATGYRSYSEHDLAAIELLGLGVAAEPAEPDAAEKPAGSQQR